MCGPGFQAVQIGFNSMSQGGLGFDLQKWLWLWVGGVRRGWLGWATYGSLSAVSSFRPPAVLGFLCDGDVMVHKTYIALKQE